MAQQHQLLMWPGRANDASSVAPPFLGLAVSHRRLLAGLQDEWLPPQPGERGHLLVAQGTANEESEASETRGPIDVVLWFSIADFPPQRVLIHRRGEWLAGSTARLELDTAAVWWPGPLPLAAGLAAASVETEEERARLRSIARQVSNVVLPEILVRPRPRDAYPIPPVAEQERLAGVQFPASFDSDRGAAALAWWAVPRLDPWIDVLAAAFTGSVGELREATKVVGAPWLGWLPWRRRDAPDEPSTLDDALWRAGFSVLPGWNGPSSAALVDELAGAAGALVPDERGLRVWADSTKDILSGAKLLDINAESPVRAALQLFLTRSEPEKYRTWSSANTAIPPAVWWGGALLAGAFCGYRRLPSAFRGERPLRAFLARQLLFPHSTDPLAWSHRDEKIRVTWGDSELAVLRESTRGAWYRANLEDDATRSAAVREAAQLGWPCLRREIHLPAGKYPYSTAAGIHQSGTTLEVESELRISVGFDVRLEDVLDSQGFRHCLATRGGHLESPPPSRHEVPYDLPRSVIPNVREVPGLIYVSGFLGPNEQAETLAAVDSAEWSNDLKRRVQHYGWRYDYTNRRVSKDMDIGELPRWADDLAERLHAEGLLPWIADQVIVNEYLENQGISQHVDQKDAFEEAIAMISLIEGWHMRFRRIATKEKVEFLLAPGSVAVMTGPSRYDWTHEIPARKRESGRKRHRRVSLTFRKVRLV